MNWKVKNYKKLRGRIEVVSGLHIGGSQEAMEIGGNDNPIVRNPVNNEPYIPGSSLKGKMRSLMEWHMGKLDSEGKVHSCNDEQQAQRCPICRTFGTSANAKESRKIGITRLIVRDCPLTEASRNSLRQGRPITEDKTENFINRITAAAEPRLMERVVPGVAFDLDIVFRVLDTDDEGTTDEKFFNDVVLKGLALLQQDFLGGGGSRGNGKIEFKELKDENGNDVDLPEILEKTA